VKPSGYKIPPEKGWQPLGSKYCVASPQEPDALNAHVRVCEGDVIPPIRTALRDDMKPAGYHNLWACRLHVTASSGPKKVIRSLSQKA
jgi:hypothetical protein